MKKLFPVVLFTALTITGCNTDKNKASEPQSTEVSDSISVEETESIAGLPEQKDSLPKGPQYTDYKFATASDAIAFMQKSANWSNYQEGILPQMAGENLEYATKLLNSPYKHFIVVDKDKMKVILFDRYGRIVHQYGMAGPRNFGTKHKKGDSRTPEGYFSAEGIYDSTDWEFTDDNGVRHPGKCFGPRFIRVKNPVTTQVGIHGTSAPGSIGRRCSHGCIRVHNENILQLVKYVEIGMPIIIIPGPTDRSVNEKEGYKTGYFNSGVERYQGAQVSGSNTTPKPTASPAVQPTDSVNHAIQVAVEPEPEPETTVHEEPTPESVE